MEASQATTEDAMNPQNILCPSLPKFQVGYRTKSSIILQKVQNPYSVVLHHQPRHFHGLYPPCSCAGSKRYLRQSSQPCRHSGTNPQLHASKPQRPAQICQEKMHLLSARSLIKVIWNVLAKTRRSSDAKMLNYKPFQPCVWWADIAIMFLASIFCAIFI